MSYSLPITRSGKSSIVPPPPWHYGVTYIGAHVKFERESANKVLPDFLTTDGEGWVYIAEFISTSESTWDWVYQDPDLTQYMEGAIGLKVYYKGNSYLYYPFMWVDKDWALVRGWFDGYAKKLAKIVMTRLHPLLPQYNKAEKGLKLGGYVVRGGNLMFRLQVELEEKGDSIPTKDFGPFLNIRYFPSRGDGELELFELVSRVREVSNLGEVWKGKATIELGGYVNDEVDALKLEGVKAGYFFTQYFKVSSTRLIERIERVRAAQRIA